ncbi:hypothetical protein F8388_024384 [Cannabis sativa]|uniref:EF-hand domain-containing protein n=1 Tax=Cannabis sativa TaxID=3483 RepID=A0A7J6DSY4_CANSA|nr:hypothetical protein G4B88_031238 [Cannabis sativa]KAF4349116.1 hypothetical protein F8388_024384 [Cannabis sativa]
MQRGHKIILYFCVFGTKRGNGGVVGKSESPKKVCTSETKHEDSNGAIDEEEMKKCFHKLGISFTEEDMDDFFKACDFNEDKGIKFNEFIVLLCLVYLLKEDQATLHILILKLTIKLKSAMPNLEATFETLVDAFVFLDKNKDGYVSRS